MMKALMLSAVTVLAAISIAFIGSNKESRKLSSFHIITSAMKENYYTHALWHVKEGKTDDFIAAWERFGNALSQVPNSPPVQGTLIQSLSEPLVFYSFGPWESLEDINAMRNNENVKKALAAIIKLCQEAKPGNYKTVLQLAFPGTREH